MRPLFFNPAKGLSVAAVCLAGLPAMADDFVVPSAVASAVVFPVGATLTRAAEFDLPAGRHQIILTDMPVIDPASLRVSAPGVTLGAVRYRDDFVPPRSDDDRAALAAARDAVDAAELRVEEARDAVAAIRVEAEAARAGIGFLEQIGQSEGLASAGPEALRDLARMIAEEGLEARRAALAAETRMRGAERGVKDALEDLNDARKALAALDTEAEDRAYLTIEVTAQAAVKGALTLEYATYDAGWIPTYDMHLTTGDDAALRIERGAYVAQDTGEDWGDIALTLSTIRPTERTEPGRVWPWLRRITDPAPMRPTVKLSSERAVGAVQMEDAPAPMAEPAIVVEEAVALSNGLSVTYSYPEPVSVANRADAVKIALGNLDITPEIFARAVPLSDETAFLMAGFTNDTGEMILNADQVQFYLDGTFIGQRPISLIAEGDETELSFGPIEGLRLERIVQDRQEGDRGVINRSNQQLEEVVLRMRNLTNRDWLVRLSDRVPYSEQEDLEITWSADPMPFAQDVDGARGVLEWRMTLGGGDSADVTLNTQIKWPEDKVLR